MALTFLFVFVALGLVLAMLLGGADVTGGFGVVLIVVTVLGVLVGAGLVILAIVLSRRILTRGGVNRPTAVTWLSLLIVLVVNTVAQRLADPFINFGGDSDVPGWSRVLVSIVLGVVAVGAGMGTWLLMAHVFRGQGTAVTDPAAVGGVPVEPVNPPEPPTTTVTPPPVSPPPPPTG